MTYASSIKKIRKRDGRIVDFEPAKIETAISKALAAAGQADSRAQILAQEVVGEAEKRFKEGVPGVEDVQDIVEAVLIKNGLAETAKSYILYRKKREEIREVKHLFGVKDDLKLGINAVKVLERRYLLKDEQGSVVETPSQLFRRIAKAIAFAEKEKDRAHWEEKFYKMLTSLEFLPNSPTLMNAGTKLGQLSACFVLPVEDSIEGIFSTLKLMAAIHQTGGGTGFDFSKLRPEGDVVGSTKGVASGPVSFIRIFDVSTDVIKQGGRRRGANMGILRFDHPDIIRFITAKEKEGELSNFNLSVAVDRNFMEKVEKNEDYELINPRTKKPVEKVKANEVFDLIVTQAWKTGDPGMIFLDRINQDNPTPEIGKIEATNPCGEQPLLPYESCNLGSINLVKMFSEDKKDVDWEKLGESVRNAVRFLDNVIEVNRYPAKEIDEITRNNRKIGLGIMGFAELLLKLFIPYDSDDALKVGEKIMKFISEEGIKASQELAEERGSFPNFEKSRWKKKGFKAMRNATVTTVAPTGTISIIANTSSGIEPLFAISFVRNVMGGVKLLEINSIFEKVAKERGFYSSELMLEIAKKGSIQEIKGIPENIKRVFVTAFDVSPEWHVKMQAAFQKYVDNAVSKTVNLPANAKIDDVRKIYLLAYKLGCKGITVYRYGSKKEQVLNIAPEFLKEPIIADSEFAGGCPATEPCTF